MDRVFRKDNSGDALPTDFAREEVRLIMGSAAGATADCDRVDLDAFVSLETDR